MQNVYEAFVKAQAKLTNPKKTETANTGAYSYKYADLSSILDHVRPILAEHGLAVSQSVGMTDTGYLSVRTIIAHESGDQIECGPIVGPSGNNWQAIGSAITYARRYALTAALGIAAEDDDDAQTAPVMTRASAPVEDDPWATPQEPQGYDHRIADAYANDKAATVPQIKKVYASAKSRLNFDDKQFAEFITTTIERPIESTKELTIGEASALIDLIEGKLS